MSQLLYIMWGKALNPVFVCFCTLIPKHSSTIYQKVYTLPIDLPWFVCWKFINNNERVYFWLLSLFLWSIHPILSPRLHCLDYCTSSVNLKSDSRSPPNFYFTSMSSHLILRSAYACPHLQMSEQCQEKDIMNLVIQAVIDRPGLQLRSVWPQLPGSFSASSASISHHSTFSTPLWGLQARLRKPALPWTNTSGGQVVVMEACVIHEIIFKHR